MDLELVIKNSQWWRDAEKMPDRHYDESSAITLADHLESVHQNLRLLQPFEGRHSYFIQLQTFVENIGINPNQAYSLLMPVALLHDIGKTKEDKNLEGPHPLTREIVKMRHPILGLVAALELLPQNFN